MKYCDMLWNCRNANTYILQSSSGMSSLLVPGLPAPGADMSTGHQPQLHIQASVAQGPSPQPLTDGQTSHGCQPSSPQPMSPDPVHDLPPELLQAGWRKFWSRREGRPYYFNKLTNESLWETPTLGVTVGHVLENISFISIYFLICHLNLFISLYVIYICLFPCMSFKYISLCHLYLFISFYVI